MPRPSNQVDKALLKSGRALYVELGCAGLSQRRLAEHAGVSPGMFHYHFASKDVFLRALLQQMCAEVPERLPANAAEPGAALECLQSTLFDVARSAREFQPLLTRLVLDASNGEVVAREFLKTNVARTLRVVLRLMVLAQRSGDLPTTYHPLQQLTFLLGTVWGPMLLEQAAVALRMTHSESNAAKQITSDVALRQRIVLALESLRQERMCLPRRT